ncbi:MAG: hypothetical protein JW760_04180 [Spirochaetales bacterium]|nr:hypothetical protein [Spirochaetales bacterium]
MYKILGLFPAIFLFSMGCQFTGDIHAQHDAAASEIGESTGTIAVVYDPGGSPFPAKTVKILADELKARGYLVEIMTAGPELLLAQSRYQALILGSPVHGAEVLPPVKAFISANPHLSIPVFAVLTGLFPKFYESYDLPNLTTLLGQSGISLTGSIKIRMGTGKHKLKALVSGLVNAVDTALGTLGQE